MTFPCSTSSQAPGLTSGFQGSMNVHCGALFWCHSDSTSVLLYFTFLSHLFPLPCGAASTVPREGFDFTCFYAFFLVCCGSDTFYIVSVDIQCQASIYTLLLCRGDILRMRLAKQETLNPPGHLVSPLVCRGSVNVHCGALLLVPQ